MFRDKLLIIFFVFFKLIWPGHAQDGYTRIIEFRNSIGNGQSTLQELIQKYGIPDEKVTQSPDKALYPNAAAGSKLTIYTFNNIGKFYFFYNGGNKNEFLLGWLLYEEYVKTIAIPKTIKEVEKYFEIDNSLVNNTIVCNTAYDGEFYFIFTNDILNQISWSQSD